MLKFKTMLKIYTYLIQIHLFWKILIRILNILKSHAHTLKIEGLFLKIRDKI